MTGEVKIITLVCFLLENLGGLSEETLLEITTANNAVSQFALSDALTVMEKKRLVAVNKDQYAITEAGRNFLNEFQSSPGVTQRKAMLREGERVLRLNKLKKALRWEIIEEDDAYAFHVTFLNEMDGSVIMEVKIRSKTREGAEEIRGNFLQNPAKIIKDTITNFF